MRYSMTETREKDEFDPREYFNFWLDNDGANRKDHAIDISILFWKDPTLSNYW